MTSDTPVYETVGVPQPGDPAYVDPETDVVFTEDDVKPQGVFYRFVREGSQTPGGVSY